MLTAMSALLIGMQGVSTSETANVQAGSPTEAKPEGEIIVTGTKLKRRVVVGSRLSRPVEPDPRGFVSQIASDTGVAGMTPGSGMDPFAGGTRSISTKSCKGSDARISQAVLCDLAHAQKAIAQGDLDRAGDAIERALSNAQSPADKFFAHRFAYQLATLQNDAGGRQDALRGMLASGSMSAEDRILAHKTLASYAIQEGDSAEAIEHLELVVLLAPGEVKAQANLGVLYHRAGQHERARERIATAVQLTSATGQKAPAEWLDYLSR